jgi:hypothetical protein
MRTFKQHMVIVENMTKAAIEMEFALVDAAKGNSGKTSYPALRKYAIIKYPKSKKPSLDLASEILDRVNIAKRGGRMSKSAEINKAQWTGNNKTPKTDIIIDGKKISLKKGSSQIMSGGSDESMSTFKVAAEKAVKGKLSDIAKEVQKGITELQKSYKSEQQGGIDIQKYGGNVYKNTTLGKSLEKKIADEKNNTKKTELQKQLKAITISTTVKTKQTYGKLDKDDILREANDKNNQLTKQFTQLFENLDFKKEFVFEAMTGKVKFGDNEGTADHFLVVDFDGSAELNQVTSSSDKYVGKILSQVSPSVKFKSTAIKTVKDGKTGNYAFRSVVGLMYDAADNTQNEINDMMNTGELEYLSEGFFDFVSTAWNKFKSFVSNLIEKVKDFITQSVNNMMEFFDIQPQISFRNNIKW